MSDTNLIIWPVDPLYSPEPAVMEAAAALLKQLVPNAEHVEARGGSGVQFNDCGANFSSVKCPRCDAELFESFGQIMQSVYEVGPGQSSGFFRMDAILPCCGAAVTLNDLPYHFPMGFATVWIEARNPGIPDFPDDALRQIADAIGAPLRTTWQRI